MATYDDILGGSAAQPRSARRPAIKTAATSTAPATSGDTATATVLGKQAEGAGKSAGNGGTTVATQQGATEASGATHGGGAMPDNRIFKGGAPSTDARRLVGMPGYSARPMATKGTEAHDGAPRSKRQMSYTELYETLNPQKPETAEERAKREKRERGQAVLASIGDGISALSNLWFTSQYSPHGFDASRGQVATTKQRWERLKQEREANSRQYFEGYLRAKAMDDANDKDERNWRHTIERERISDDRYEAKAAQDKALADLNERLKAQQLSEAEYKAEVAKVKAQYAEQNEKLDLGYKQAGIQQRTAAAGASRASATASTARADYYRKGGSGGNGKKITLKVGDTEYTYSSKEDYERDVLKHAKDLGVKEWVVVPDGKDNLKKPKYKHKRKGIEEIAAEVERRSAERLAAEKKEADFSEYVVSQDSDDEDDDFSEYEM